MIHPSLLCYINLYIKSYREGGRTSPTLSQVHISPISSPHKSNFKSTSPSLRGEVDLKLDLWGLEIGLIWTWIKIARGALGSQVLRSRACEAEENLTAKCTECNFKPMSTKRQPSTPSRACEARCTWLTELTLVKSPWSPPLLFVGLNVSTMSQMNDFSIFFLYIYI